MAQLTGLFAQLNNAISQNPLNKSFNFGVEGQPASPMDTVNPMLQGAVQKLGNAAGINDAQQLDTSQQKRAEQQKLFKETVLAGRARALGLEEVAEALESGGAIQDYMPQIVKAEEAKQKAAVADLKHARELQKEERIYARDIAAKDLEWKRKIALSGAEHKQDLQRDYARWTRDLQKRTMKNVGGEVAIFDGNMNRVGTAGITPEAWSAGEQAKKDAAESAEAKHAALEDAAARAAETKHGIVVLKDMLSKSGGTGGANKIASYNPFSDDYDSSLMLEHVRSRMTFDVILWLKAMGNGNTGLGQISAPELELLKANINALDMGMAPEVFNRQLDDIYRFYDKARKNWENLPPGNEPKVSKKAVGPGVPSPSPVGTQNRHVDYGDL